MDFHVTIDFNDDLWFAEQAWNEARLRELVRVYADRGIKGIHWIDQGTAADGLYDPGGYLDRLGTAHTFIREVPDPLRVAADEAHRNGMAIWSVLKIFDLCAGMPWSALPAGEPHDPPVGVSFIGGEGVWGHRWIREHPELRAELHPALQEHTPRQPVRTIRLWHEGPALASSAWHIFVSDNNRNYREYKGPLHQASADRRRLPPIFTPAPETATGPAGTFTCITLTDLAITEPFLALVPEAPTALANTLAALAEIEDCTGQPAVFTYGLVPVMTPENRRPDWRTAGIAFDAAIDTPVPGRGWTMTASAGRTRFTFADHGFLGLARGRNTHLGGVVELASPEVRRWLTGMAGRAVEAGCDGVDIRTTTHTESLDWENYGFGREVRNAFKAHHGIDIGTAPFNRALWRRLRGESFDRLLGEAAAAVHGRGKQLSIQLSRLYDRPADGMCFHEIFWDWQTWLTAKTVDTVNFTAFTFREPFYGKAVRLCRDLDIPMLMSPSMHAASDAAWAAEGPELFRRCAEDGFQAYNIYESASVLRLTRTGFQFLCPSLWSQVADRQSC